MILKVLEFFGIIILISLGVFVLIILAICMFKEIAKMTRKWGEHNEI